MHREKRVKAVKTNEYLTYYLNDGFGIVEASSLRDAIDMNSNVNVIDVVADIDPIIIQTIRNFI